MFNIFNKKNEGSKKDCYLINSGVFDKNVLDVDQIDQYNDFLKDAKFPDRQKDLIRNFLIPYKISPLKFNLNQQYYRDPYPVDLQNDHKHIAPSLRKIKENSSENAMGYPSWFFTAFPDVALWAITGEGNKLIKERFQNLTEEEIIDGNHIRPNILNETIKLYLQNTNKLLECKKF